MSYEELPMHWKFYHQACRCELIKDDRRYLCDRVLVGTVLCTLPYSYLSFTLAHTSNPLIPVADRRARIAKTKQLPLLAQPQLYLTLLFFLPFTHHNISIKYPPLLPGRVNFATLSNASLLVSFSPQGVSVDMATEKTPEVGDKGTWSFLQRVAREQPFSFCGFYTSN